MTALAAVRKNPNQLVSAAADGQIILWQISPPKQIRQFNHRGPVAAVAIRADGERIVSAGADKVTRLWNSRDGKQLAELRGDLRARQRVDAASAP